MKLALFALAASLVSSLRLLNVPGRINVDTPDRLDPNTHVVLNDGEYVAYLKPDNSFNLQHVLEGSYVMTVRSTTYQYTTYKLDVAFYSATKGDAFVREYNYGSKWIANDTTSEGTLDIPMTIEPVGEHEYFVKREGFNVASMLMNPYMLMMGFSLVMMLVLPKMMSSLDPEALEEINKSQKDMQKLTQGDLSGALAGMMSSKK
jgi:hypothetical protein